MLVNPQKCPLTTWVFDFNPSDVDPYFTASLAYSIYNQYEKLQLRTWRILPFGSKVTQFKL